MKQVKDSSAFTIEMFTSDGIGKIAKLTGVVLASTEVDPGANSGLTVSITGST